MKSLPQPVAKLIDAFDKLPGIGPKTAARLAFYLLHVPQQQLEAFAEAIINLKKKTVRCSICFTIADKDPCSICSDNQRDKTVICVVEQPLDVIALERIGKFNGVYHVLHGAISPLNNIGPEDILIPQLMQRLRNNEVRELILATNPTMEGEATAMYIKESVKKNGYKFIISRLAYGLPIGADIDYADEVTLAKALEGRRVF